VFRLIVDLIIENSLHYIETDEKFRAGFLQGVFAAEGSIELRKNGSLHFIYISQYDDRIRAIIKKTLNLSGIRFTEKIHLHSKDLRISHLDNFERIHMLNMCAISAIKLRKFKSGLAMLRKSHHAGIRPGQTRREIIELLKSEGPLTISQLASKLGKSYYTIWDHIISSRASKKPGLYWDGFLEFANKDKKERSWSVRVWN